MSYSISIRAKSRQEAKQKVADALLGYSFDSPYNAHSRDGVSIASAIYSRVDSFAEVEEGKEMVVEAYGHSVAHYGTRIRVGDLSSAESTLKVYVVPAAT